MADFFNDVISPVSIFFIGILAGSELILLANNFRVWLYDRHEKQRMDKAKKQSTPERPAEVWDGGDIQMRGMQKNISPQRGGNTSHRLQRVRKKRVSVLRMPSKTEVRP